MLRSATDGQAGDGGPETEATAADLARQPVISVRPTATVHEAAEAMVRYGAQHVVVVDPAASTPVGVVSALDIADLLARGPR